MRKVGGGGGITPFGLISVLLLVLVMLGVAFLGNRVWPLSSQTDSAWRSVGGNAQELTDGLRRAGYTCSDEGTLAAVHVHRLCAKYDDASSVAIEFVGTRDGQVQRAYISSAGRLTPQDQEAAALALDAGIPDPSDKAAARTKLAAGATDRQQIAGPWGTAGYDDDGVFLVDRGWTGAPTESVLLAGGVDGVRRAATEVAYACSGTAPMTCRRNADAASWTLTVEGSSDPSGIASVRLEGIVTNPDELDPAAELEGVLPDSSTRDRLVWFVRTADQRHGHAGFAGGMVVDYRVTRDGDRPANVSITAHSACRPSADGQTMSC